MYNYKKGKLVNNLKLYNVACLLWMMGCFATLGELPRWVLVGLNVMMMFSIADYIVLFSS